MVSNTSTDNLGGKVWTEALRMVDRITAEVSNLLKIATEEV